ncbi:hypothetical protein [Salibacterium sp. K-3]
MFPLFRYISLIVLAAGAVLVFAACGGDEENAMTLDNENWNEVNLADKEQPTVLFHFTGVT